MYAHTWEDLEINQVQTPSQIKQDDCPKETQKKMPHISDFTYHKCTTLFLSLPMLLSTCYHFPSYRALCLNSFIQSQKSRALSLDTGPWGLVPGIQSFLCLSLTSISVQGTKILLLAAAGWVAWNQKVHYFIQWTTLHSAKATTFKNHHFRVGENEFSDYKEFICFNENINVFPCPTFYFIQIWMNSKISSFSHVV